jgi:hypothetical protein
MSVQQCSTCLSGPPNHTPRGDRRGRHRCYAVELDRHPHGPGEADTHPAHWQAGHGDGGDPGSQRGRQNRGRMGAPGLAWLHATAWPCPTSWGIGVIPTVEPGGRPSRSAPGQAKDGFRRKRRGHRRVGFRGVVVDANPRHPPCPQLLNRSLCPSTPLAFPANRW